MFNLLVCSYRTAIFNYHRCIMNAKVVTQLTTKGLEQLALFGNGSMKKLQTGESFDDNISEEDHTPILSHNEPTNDTNGISAPCCSANGIVNNDIIDISPGEKLQNEANDLIAKCFNNLAACIINGPLRQKDDYLRAVSYCDSVILQNYFLIFIYKKMFRHCEFLAITKRHFSARELPL